MKNANYNSNWFEDWNENTAYFLGFWLADGCVSINRYKRRGRVYAYKRIFINNTDVQAIRVLSDIIGVIPSIKKKRKKEKTMMVLSWNSDQLFDWLFSFVGSTDKTNNMKWFQQTSHMNHFVRGFFDGDGSIYIKSYKSRHGKSIVNLASSFTASAPCCLYLQDLRNYLTTILGLSARKVTVNSKKTSSKLIYGQYDTMKLCEWMYAGASVFMDRKKEIWDSFDKVKLLKSTKFFSNKL